MAGRLPALHPRPKIKTVATTAAGVLPGASCLGRRRQLPMGVTSFAVEWGMGPAGAGCCRAPRVPGRRGRSFPAGAGLSCPAAGAQEAGGGWSKGRVVRSAMMQRVRERLPAVLPGAAEGAASAAVLGYGPLYMRQVLGEPRLSVTTLMLAIAALVWFLAAAGWGRLGDRVRQPLALAGWTL